MGTISRIDVDASSMESIKGDVESASTAVSCFRWKAVADPVFAALLLIPGVPLILILVFIVRMTSKGPGLFRQVRVGKGGRRFTMYKLRTMSQDAEKGTGAVWSQANDPRVTRLGRVLRKMHLDELPQLFNVLKGEMALIGPRPERPEFVEILKEEVPGYMERLAVRPGVTGLAQINLPPDSDLMSVWRKLQLDVEYIRTATLWLDFRMFLCTAVRLMAIPGDLVMLMFCVKRPVPEPPAEIERLLGSGDGAGHSVASLVKAARTTEAVSENEEDASTAQLKHHKAEGETHSPHTGEFAPSKPR